MDMRQLKYFVVCAEQKSFSKAAELLYTSQPHVSMVIKSLEEELGQPLFERSAKGMTLTQTGKINYEYARSMLTTSELMLASSFHGGNNFTIYTNSSSNMAVLFSKFFSLHPDWHYRYMEAGVEEIMEKVALRETEFGFVFVPESKRNALNSMLARKKLHYESLVQSDLVIYVGREHPFRNREKISLEELSLLQFIQMTDDFFSVREIIESQKQVHHLAAERVIETNSSHVMVQMLRSSKLCNLCSYWLRDKFKYYDFKMIPVEDFEKCISFGYIYKDQEEFSPMANKYIQFVIDTIKKEEE